MPVPSLRFSIRRLAVVVLLAAIGAGVWFFVLRDDGGSEESGKDRGKAERGPISDDPLVRKMSVAEQVDQVLMLGFAGTSPDAPSVADLAHSDVGAVIVRAENWEGVETGKKLVAELGQGEGIPPLVAASQEGGIYRSFADLPPAERALDIGREGSIDAARVWAQTTSKALVGAGFHLNLFPVADVATLDSPFAGRAFSDDPAEVTAFTDASLEGCEDAGIACAPLHFPGLGAASQDTAEGPATVSSPLEILTTRDLVPFQAASRKAPAMVLSLALYPDFDPIVPGALTPSLATGLLRDEIGFKGVAISDDLGAGAVSATLSVDEAAVRALAAGTDLVQIGAPEEAEGVAGAIERAVGAGDVPKERLAEAAERVIALKRELGLIAG